jgi:hypothetical protein
MRTFLLVVLAATTMGGCLKDSSTTTLKLDGSGTFTQVTTIEMEKAKAYVAQLKEQARGLGMPPDEASENPFAAVDARKREAALKLHKGVRVVGTSQSEDAKKRTRTYELRVAFDSLQQMYGAGVVEDVSVKLERVSDPKAWKLTVRHVFDGNDREPLTGKSAENLRKMRAAMLKRYEKLWGSLAITSTLQLPTKVLATNGQPRITKAGHFVTWRIGFTDLTDPSRLIQHVTFEDAEGLKLTPFELSANDIANAIEEAELAAEEAANSAKKAKDKAAPK